MKNNTMACGGTICSIESHSQISDYIDKTFSASKISHFKSNLISKYQNLSSFTIFKSKFIKYHQVFGESWHLTTLRLPYIKTNYWKLFQSAQDIKKRNV